MHRLSGLDAGFLYLETSSQLLHVCGLVVVDPSTMPGGYSFHKLAGELATRIKLLLKMPDALAELLDAAG
jgi:diacylglycerol O-acyltransferase